MLNPLVLLAHHLVLNLLLCAHLLLNELPLLLLTRLHLLALNDLLERAIFDLLLVAHNLQEVALLPLLHLHVIDFSPHLILEVAPCHIHVLLVHLLGGPVLSLAQLLLLLLLPLPLLALLLNLHVALASHQDVSRSFLSLVEFLPRLLLLLLEQCDSI